MHTPDYNKVLPQKKYPETRRCGLVRRSLIILYDSFAVLAIFFLVGALWVAANSGKAIETDYFLYPLYLFSLLVSAWLYFALSWRRNGMTLGMRAWHTRLVTNNGAKISWWQCGIRFIGAWLSLLAMGAGFLMALFRQDKACWHDLMSDSYLLRE